MIQKCKKVGILKEVLKESENSNLCKNKGITLIALIVTIIALLILVGISIIMMVGENRNFKKSK